MGRICFQTSRIQFLDEPLLRSCYMTGLEGIAWEREITFSGTRLTIDRQTHESGHFFFPWRSETGLEFMLGTTSLRESSDDYHLEVELARGTLHRLRAPAGGWDPAQAGARAGRTRGVVGVRHGDADVQARTWERRVLVRRLARRRLRPG